MVIKINGASKCIAIMIFFITLLACDATLEKINTKIAVVSDPHYYSSGLGAEGAAFEKYIYKNYKHVAESQAINEAAIEQLKSDDTEIVIIPGDLTKDGEKINHLEFAEKLQELQDAGKKVYVINGNHDINNPEAVEYYNDTEYPLETIDAEEFVDIYYDFGYSESIDRDSDSLSYIVEPIDGLWLMAIDSCIYENNLLQDHSTAGGHISESTRLWIKNKLEEAKEKNKVVACFMHHGIMQHFSVQKKMFPDFVVEDHESISKLLADGGVKVVFTGHFHAMDIAKKRHGLNVIHDIETGSLISYPCSYRKIEVVKGRKLILSTTTIDEIAYDIGDLPFQEYAYNYAFNGVLNYSSTMVAGLLIKSGFPIEEAFVLAEEIVNTEMLFETSIKEMMARALLDHSYGGEFLSPKHAAIITQMLASEEKVIKLLGGALFSLWTDLTPFDNNRTLNL